MVSLLDNMDGYALRAVSITQKSLLKADFRGSCSIRRYGLGADLGASAASAHRAALCRVRTARS